LDFNDSGFTVSEDVWYKIKIDWGTDGKHVATLYDANGHRLVRASAVDKAWQSGGIGYDAYLANSGGTVYFDFVTLDLDYLPQVNVIDSFEDGNLDEYRFDQGQSGASIVTTPAYRGSNALAISDTNTELISTSGLKNYPSAGDVFSFRTRATGGANKTNFAYGVQNHTNRYYVVLNFTDDSLKLMRYEDGTSYELTKQTSGFSFSMDTWYEVKVDWQSDGTHTVSLYNPVGDLLAQISAADSAWKAGGIGYDAYLSSSGGTVYYDYITLDSANLNLGFKQTIDSFEDEDLAEYEIESGNSSGVSVVNSPSLSGKGTLKISDVRREMISTSGLEHYPTPGDIFRCWIQGTDGLDNVNLTYGVQDHTNRYHVAINFTDNKIGLYKYENGSTTALSTDGHLTLREDQWYRVEVDWRPTGTHILTLYTSTGVRLTQLSATDTTWSDGGVGFDAYLDDGGTVYFDHVAIHEQVVDDFEDGDLSEYNGDTGGFTVQSSTTIDHDKSLEGTTAPSTIARTDIQTTRGWEYETTVVIESGSGAKPAIVGCIQDPAAR
jgi:hypothetical protein